MHTPGRIVFDRHEDWSQWYGNLTMIVKETPGESTVIRTLTCNLKYGTAAENEAHACLLRDSWNSYVNHFGPHAVSAAQSDALGEALELLRMCIDPNFRDYTNTFDIHKKIDALLSRTKGNA